MTQLTQVIQNRQRLAGIAALALGVVGAAPSPATPPQDTGRVTGTVTVARRTGIPDHAFLDNARYQTRALRHVTVMDYQKAGPVIVYLNAGEAHVAPRSPLKITLARQKGRLRFAPPFASATIGPVSIRNDDAKPHILYLRGEKDTRQARVPARSSVHFELAETGKYEIYLLDAESVGGRLFIAGTHAMQVDSGGAFTLEAVPPGPHTLHAWHARFPPARSSIQVRASHACRADLTLSVDALSSP